MERLPQKVRNQIGRTLERLAGAYNAGTRPQDIRPIEGEPGSFGIESGEYRILYRVEDDVGRIRVWRIATAKMSIATCRLRRSSARDWPNAQQGMLQPEAPPLPMFQKRRGLTTLRP